jgi:hypothetical protein
LIDTKPIGTATLISLAFLDSLERVKVFEKECPAINHIMIYDIRIKGSDDAVNSVYAISPDLQYNLRLGHTIAEVYDPNDYNVK